jgi:hypothetical protein
MATVGGSFRFDNERLICILKFEHLSALGLLNVPHAEETQLNATQKMQKLFQSCVNEGKRKMPDEQFLEVTVVCLSDNRNEISAANAENCSANCVRKMCLRNSET